MEKKQKCFISYNKSDCDLDTIKSLIDYLEKYSNDSIDFLIDENLKIGKDFNRFMNIIKEVEAIIVLLTPEYKRKADEKIESGVYTEYKTILERLEEDQKIKQSDIEYLNSPSTFCFIPIIFSRDHANSCPQNINQYKRLDFSTLQFVNKKLIKSIESHYELQFRKICSEISAIKSINAASVREDYKQELHKLLFAETKHDNIENKPIGQNKELYVKTRSFYGLKTQETYLFLGRKGCGKSTLGPLLFLFEKDKYKKHIEININQIDLEYSINITLSTALRSDLDIVIKITSFFELVWEVLLLYKCCEVLVDENENGNLSDSQKKNITPVEEILNKIKNDAENEFGDERKDKNNNPIFQWSFFSVTRYIEKAIQKSGMEGKNFHYDLLTLLKRDIVLSDIFSDTVLKNIYSIISECKRKIFVSFDGFDSLFENFRNKTNNNSTLDQEIKNFRKKIEVGFLEGFLNLAMSIKSNEKNDAIYKNIDICVTVPKDRFFEIKELQRDSYRFIGAFQEIKWTGIELSIMLRKRLELLYNERYLSRKEDSPQIRLISVVKNLPILESLPSKIKMNINNKYHEIDTFLYILRHTFGRPREILIYYSKLIAIARDIRKRGHDVDEFAVGKIVSETTFDIIREEFISEFKNYCCNIKDILKTFKKSTQILSKSELEKKLGMITFHFINEKVKDFKSKFEFLFDIGFIGIEVPKPQIERYRLLIGDIFSFNTDHKTLENLKGNDYDDCNFIIHPIFYEYLGLDLSNQNRPILHLDWDYLKRQDIYI